jgi:peptide/nickel transport system substrate-binding protein
MSFFGKIFAVLKTYDYRDKVISAIAFAVFLLMIVKMIVFPYGLFGFGTSNIYTEGVVSRSGIQNLNPLFVDYNEADREISSLVFSGLMKYDPNQKAVVEDIGRLSISEDKTEYTFRIREGIRWHDGRPVSAEDVYFTFGEIILDPAFQNEILKSNFAGVQVTLVDESTVKFKLEKPNVFFASNFTVGILPKHILGNVAAADLLSHDFNRLPIGTGPYMVDNPAESFFDGRMQITLIQNPNYYGDRPNIEMIRFVVYSTMDELMSQISSINGVPKVTGQYKADFDKDERFNLIPYELPQYTALFLNMESEVLKRDQKIRLALQKAIDKDELVERLAERIKVDTPLMELNQEEWVYVSDLAQAQGALKDAGYNYASDDKDNSGVRYNSDGDALTLQFIARAYDEGTYQQNEMLEVVGFVTEAWREIGVDVQIKFLGQEDFNEHIISRNYDVLLVGQILGYNMDTYSYWHSTQAGPRGQNFSNYKSFQIDSLIEAIRSTFDQEEKEKNLEALAKRLREDVPAIFLYRPVYYYAADGKVEGIDMEGVVFSSDRFSKISLWR